MSRNVVEPQVFGKMFLPETVYLRMLSERDVPDYIEADHSKMTAKLTRVPAPNEVPYPVQMEPNLVVEYYSR